jgi:flavodoxin
MIKSLIILFSYHHGNTAKLADVFARVLGAQIIKPQEVDPEQLQEYDLVGFGSGIYDSKHHQSLLDLADRLPKVAGKKAFIFSTCGVPAIGMNKEYVEKNHALLKEKLESKGYVIIDEFSCIGLNTNSFLRFTAGINKGRPNAEDLKNSEEFAESLKRKLV